jgi:hypothetical protein
MRLNALILLANRRGTHYTMAMVTLLLSFAMLTWGVHVKTSIRLHADMSEHKAASKPGKGQLATSTDQESAPAAAPQTQFQCLLALLSLAAMQHPRLNRAMQGFLNVLRADNPNSIYKYFALNAFSSLPPPIA